MTFEEVLFEAVRMLQRLGRVSYRAMQRQFDLDEDYLKDLKEAVLYTYGESVNDEGQGLAWTGEPLATPSNVHTETDRETRFQTLLRIILALLQRERRVTYRELKYMLDIDDGLLSEIRKELLLKHAAIDEEGEVLAWTGDAQPMISPIVAPTTTLTDILADPPDLSLTDIASDQLGVGPERAHTVTEAERRQLTVMFCDLVGSTDLSTRLDPENLREIVRAYQETAAKVIERYEGHIAQYLGDGLLIYFGYPLAQEDDAQRAVHAGLGIVAAMGTLNTHLKTDHSVELAVRIGIHTGRVVVGEMGGGDRHENLALGETPNIASRIEGLAPSNTVVISSVTAQLVQRSFILEELGPKVLKGLTEPMSLYAVASPREVEHDDHEAIRAGGFDTLLGRGEEVGLLLRRWEQSKSGLGQVVLLNGEAGIGKSSLVEGLRGHVRREGLTRIDFRCSPYHTNSAFYPIIEHVKRALDWQPEDLEDTQLMKLEQGLRDTNLPLEEAVPLLAWLLSLSLPESRYPALTLSPAQQRQQAQDILVAWLLEEAERLPVLAVWEDLHWADPSTLETLGLFVDQAPTADMMQVLTFRPEFEPPWPTRSHMTPITLNRLERPQVETLVKRLASGKVLPVEVIEHIVGKTDGVPLYVEEMTKMLLESDLLQEEADSYMLTAPLLKMAIPDTLQDSLMARLDQLGTAKEVAQLGAVLGREFTYNLMQTLASQDEGTLQAALAQLVEAELLYQRGRPPRARYMFKHALIQDVAYQSLLRSTRQQQHDRIAHLLAAMPSGMFTTQPELIAYHYAEAGKYQDASVYWQRAGEQAHQRSAYTEAINHLHQGVDGLQMLPESPERTQQELDMHILLGSALMAIRGNAASEVERVYARARELCGQVGSSPQLAPVLAGLRRHYFVSGDTQAAREVGEELLQLGEELEDATIQLWGHFGVGPPLLSLGDIVAARDYLERGLTRYASQATTASASSYGTNPVASSMAWLSLPLWMLGYPEQALQKAQEALQIVESLSSVFSKAIVISLTTHIHVFRRDVEAVRLQKEAMITLCSEQGMADFLALGTMFHGWSLMMQQEIEDGITQIRQGLIAAQTAGNKAGLTMCHVWLAEAACKADQVEVGFQSIAEAQEQMSADRQRYYEAELYRLQGELLLKAQDGMGHAEWTPESCFQKALDIARQQEAKSWELRAATSLARLWQQQSKRQEAYDLLAPVYGWFTEGFDTADLKDAKALLTELGA